MLPIHPGTVKKKQHYVSKLHIIGFPPGVHQQLKMLRPKVGIWFVMREFMGNSDVNWSIPHPQHAHKSMCIQGEGTRIRAHAGWDCVGVHSHVHGRIQADYSAINHKSPLVLCEHVLIASSSLIAFFLLFIPLCKITEILARLIVCSNWLHHGDNSDWPKTGEQKHPFFWQC